MLIRFLIGETSVLTMVRLAWQFLGCTGFPVLVVMQDDPVQDFLTKEIQISDGGRDNDGIAIEAVANPHTGWTHEADHPDALESINV